MQYIYPCKPNRITIETLEIFENPSWVAEIKKNGWRAIIEKDNGKVILWTRHHTLIKGPLTDIRKACGNLPDGTMLDKERPTDYISLIYYSLKIKTLCRDRLNIGRQP
ncbi:MAG: hypothetical protein ABIF11_11670 [Nitrospirota bacterium]